MQDPADLTGAALQDQEANVFDDDGQEDARQALEDVQEAGAHLPSVEPTTAPTELDLVTRLARQEELMQQLLNQQAATNQPSSTAHPVIHRMFDQQEAASSRPPSMAGLNAELAAPINGIPGSDATTNPEAFYRYAQSLPNQLPSLPQTKCCPKTRSLLETSSSGFAPSPRSAKR